MRAHLRRTAPVFLVMALAHCGDNAAGGDAATDARGTDASATDGASGADASSIDVIPGADAAPGEDVTITSDAGAGEDASTPPTDARASEDAGTGTDASTPPADAGGADAGTGADAGAPTGVRMRFGVNMGYQTSAIDDSESADMAHAAGANSNRAKLSEQHLTRWGDTIEQGDMAHYASLGMRDIVSFIGGPTAEHSTAPAGTADWELEHYAPRNLHEPIFLPDGSVNPQNYWAAFVARAVRSYSRWVRTWEVWNEPDQVGGNWRVTEQWATRAPTAAELPWWHASFFDYVRIMRVTYEVVHRLDPTARVALGGIGYESFLSAMVRYTDEPRAGAVDATHPERGSAYFDTVSFHYYPVFSPGNSDAGAAGIVTSLRGYQRVLEAAGVRGKRYIVTESGAPRFAFGTMPGGTEYARNYVMKVMALAHDAGIEGVDWFALGDGAAEGASMDSFSYMGLYRNYATATRVEDARMTDTGVAYATMGQLLDTATADPATTHALEFDTSTLLRGTALRLANGKRAYVLWALSAGTTEAGRTTLHLGSGAVNVYAWDYSRTRMSQRLEPSGGRVTVQLTASPVVLIEQ